MKTSVKKYTILLLCLLIAAAFTPNFALASEVPSPSVTPRLVTVSFYGADGSRMSFNWNTTDYTDSDVQVVRADDGAGFASANVIRTKGDYYVSKASTADGYVHTCVVSGLAKGTKYFYRVGDEELNAWSGIGSFTTEKGTYSPFTFLHVSDPQASESRYYEAYEQLLLSAAETSPFDFVINTGDIVNNNWEGYIPNLDQWEWALTDRFDAIMKDYPLMAAAGNHEAADYDFSARFHFDTPATDDGRTGNYYSFNYNGVHFVCVNTNDTTGRKSAAEATGLSQAQYDWIAADLEANKNAEWTVVYMHKGMYDSGGHCTNNEGEDYDIARIRAQLAPLFTKYKVPLVLQGHDHLYSKTYPLTVTANEDGTLTETGAKDAATVKRTYNGETYTLYDGNLGTVYLNSGSSSGSKYYVPIEGKYSTDLIELTENPQTLMYAKVTFDGDMMLVSTYVVDGKYNSTPYYSFGVVKGGNAGGNDSGGDAPTAETGGLSVGAVVAIAAGAAVLLGGAAVVVILTLKKRK